jgi:hypothetical protein
VTGLLAQRPRPAGADRVDEHHVGGVDQRFGIRAEAVGGRVDVDRIAGLHAHRREAAHVQPHRRRARAAIVEEGDRPIGAGGAVARVGGVEDRGARLAVVVADRQRARGRGVGDALAGDGDRAVADGGMLVDRWTFPGVLDIGDHRVAMAALGLGMGRRALLGVRMIGPILRSRRRRGPRKQQGSD